MAANLVATRGNRCSASILGYLEKNVYESHPDITTHEQKAIRQMVLDTINSFKDLAIDRDTPGDQVWLVSQASFRVVPVLFG